MKYLSEKQGRGCIVARVVAYSQSQYSGIKIITFELEYPRFIHSEFMTHRVFSRNAMSSRAVPIEKMIEQVRYKPAMPIEWGKNTKGMQAKETFSSNTDTYSCEYLWIKAARMAAQEAERLMEFGLHKQIVNRVLEPFQVMKTVMTTTEIDNFFYLRCHKDAQPEIQELANCMYEAMVGVEPTELGYGEWHLPYIDMSIEHNESGALQLETALADLLSFGVKPTRQNLFLKVKGLDLNLALKVSASCCAQVSYRVLDDSLEKAINIYDRLVESKPVHSSPFEHQATPMFDPRADDADEFRYELFGKNEQDGVTHVDKEGDKWSGNFKHWVQYRQLIKDNVCKTYTPKEE